MTAATANACATNDYGAIYAEYWSRADRWGASSFSSAEMLAHQVLVTCGPGRMLDVGCGMGELVRSLLAKGVDARGVDIAAKPVAHAAALAPGRFEVASVLELPFESGAFDTVVCTDCLEHLAEDDVPRAIAEIARVAERSVFLTIGTRPDRDKRWHLTIRDRAWWEQRLMAAGLRKHPAAAGVLSYESLENEGPSITVVMEKIPAEAAAKHPLQSLREGRGLHMDMLRESGRRSDAHIARYAMAAGYVRRGDVVIDAACGMGYGAAVLSRLSGLGKVIGVDSDASAVAYAQESFGPSDPRCEFHAGDCQDLSSVPDASVDMVVSMETLEHLADPAVFLRHVERILRPGGRFVASVPNDWADETGNDPNPHHLHVYTWERLAKELQGEGGAGLSIERAYAQTAGGGMKLTGEPRRLTAMRVDERGRILDGGATPAEWWLAVAMKPATGEAAARAEYKSHAPVRGQREDFHPLAFGIDYRNGWLGDAMVMIGHRATDDGLLERTARQVLAESPRDSADAGAAMCVLAYRMLEGPGRAATEIDDLLGRLADFDAAVADRREVQLVRWRISNRFASARLLLAMGRRDEARTMFLRCAELDPTPFSPLLACKTVEALYHAGLLAASDGDIAAARAAWERGLGETRRVLAGDWRHIWDDVASPAPFAMPEVGAIADAAAMCAAGINGLSEWIDRPGRAWRNMHAGTKADYRSWIRHLERARTARIAGPVEPPSAEGGDAKAKWLEQQVANWRSVAEQREGAIVDLKAWTERLSQTRAWLDGQLNNWKGEADRRGAAIDQLKKWAEQLTAGKNWLEQQLGATQSRVEAAERRASEATIAAAEAQRGAAEATARLGQRACEHAAEVMKLQTAIGDAQEEMRGLREQIAALSATVKSQEEEIRGMRTAAGVLRTGASVVMRAGRRGEPAGSPGPSENRAR